MQKGALFVSFIVAVAFLGSCATVAPPKAEIVKKDIVGHWEGDWGSMYLKVVGDKVRGIYTYDDGRVIGSFADGMFKGWWSEAPSREAADDAGAVEFKFVRTAGGLSLDGRWKYGNDPSEEWSEDWDLDWSGGAIPAEIDALFLIDSDFPES